MQIKQLPTMSILVLFLNGCVSTQEISFSYSEEEIQPYLLSGNAKITGQAFLRQQGGGVVVCAGEPVILLPNIGAFAEAYRLRKQRIVARVKGSGDGRVTTAGLTDPVASKAIRQTLCDAQGNFELADLPAGNWLLYSRVQWVVDSIRQGSDLIAEITTRAAGDQRVLLTDANRI
jgi:hypothetical protein